MKNVGEMAEIIKERGNNTGFLKKAFTNRHAATYIFAVACLFFIFYIITSSGTASMGIIIIFGQGMDK